MPTIADVMTPNPQSADANESIRSVAQAMEEGNFGSLAVLESGQVVGIVTDRDIAIRAVAHGLPVETPVSQVMSGTPICVSTDCELEEAAALMQEKQVRRLYVVENETLVGVVALADIVDSAGDRLSGETIEKISEG